MKKALLSTLAVLALVLAVLAFLPLPIPIHRSLTAVTVRLDDPDPAYPHTMGLIINGTYRFRLFGADTFTGDIMLEDYPSTHSVPVDPLTFAGGAAALVYEGQELGTMTASTALTKAAIRLGSGEEGSFVAAPAETQQEALAILRQFSGKGDIPSADVWPAESR